MKSTSYTDLFEHETDLEFKKLPCVDFVTYMYQLHFVDACGSWNIEVC
jgi:hypothetical protein